MNVRLVLLVLLLKLNVEFEFPVTVPVKNKSRGGLNDGNLALERCLFISGGNVALDSKTFFAIEAFPSCLIGTLVKIFLSSMTCTPESKERKYVVKSKYFTSTIKFIPSYLNKSSKN